MTKQTIPQLDIHPSELTVNQYLREKMALAADVWQVVNTAEAVTGKSFVASEWYREFAYNGPPHPDELTATILAAGYWLWDFAVNEGNGWAQLPMTCWLWYQREIAWESTSGWI